jgi:hypothetical protein
VYAVDINGKGSETSIVSQMSCNVPEDMNKPVLQDVTRETFTLSWDIPDILGGCPITGFSLFRDDGSNGDINIPVDASVLDNKPDVFYYTVTLDSSMTGLPIHVKIQAHNIIGYAESKALLLILADQPGKPTPAPSSGLMTTTNQIHIVFENANTDDGGSPVTEYELQMDDGRLGEFQTILISYFETEVIITDHIESGYTYRFRYRVANVNGFSEYSDVSYILPFNAPDAPPAPYFISATQTEVTLGFSESLGDNGNPISSYELWIDAGDDTLSDFTQVTTYPSYASQHTLTVVDDGLGSLETVYRVKFRAKNANNNYSPFSNELIFALGALPSQPDMPVKDIDESTSDSIMVNWN